MVKKSKSFKHLPIRKFNSPNVLPMGERKKRGDMTNLMREQVYYYLEPYLLVLTLLLTKQTDFREFMGDRDIEDHYKNYDINQEE